MTMKPKIVYISQIVFAFYFLVVFGSMAQNQTNDYSGLSLKLTCAKREIVAGQNFEYQAVLSNSAQRITIAPPALMAYFDLIIQQDGKNISYQLRYLRNLGPDREIEANGIWQLDGDLYEGWPFGLPVGNLTLFASYSPNSANNSFKIKSNTIQLMVLPRSQQQEAEYNDYMKQLRMSGEDHIQQGLRFLTTYTNSIFEPRVRLEIARRCTSGGLEYYDLKLKTLEVVSLLPSATKQEVARKHDLASRALEKQGYLYEAIVELETSPVKAYDNVINNRLKPMLKYKQLAAQVRLEPEALKVSPGILTAHVRLPEGYPVSGITTATCDYAAAERMMLSDDKTEMIMKFRRQDIEAALARIGKNIDTNFVVHGTWQGEGKTKPFWGAASITKIVGAKEEKEKKEKEEKKEKKK